MRTDIESALKKYKIHTFGSKKVIERAESMLWNEEKVIFITPTNAVIGNVYGGKKDKLPGVFVLTDKRIVFVYRMLKDETFLAFGLSEIQSVVSKGGTHEHIIIQTTTKILDVLTPYGMAKGIVSLIYKAMNPFRNATQASSGERDGSLDQVEKLYHMCERGIITQEEFESKKRQLLGL